MGQEVSNEGQLGIDSIRIGGMKLDDLPIAEGAITKQQLPEILEADRKNTIDNIVAKYPKQSVAWVRGAIIECEATLTNVRGLKESQNKMINDYSGHISLCAHRDRELTALDNMLKTGGITQGYHDERAKKLKLDFPPYDVKAMKQQIQQCKEAIVRSDVVIDKEHQDISTLRELLTKCMQRDVELKEFGVTVK